MCFYKIFQVGDVLGIDWLQIKPLVFLSICTKILMYIVRNLFCSIILTT